MSSFQIINACLKKIAEDRTCNEAYRAEIFRLIFQEAEKTFCRYSASITELLEWLKSGRTAFAELQLELHSQNKNCALHRQDLVTFCHRIWHSRHSTDLKLYCSSVLLLLLNGPTNIEFRHYFLNAKPVTLLSVLEGTNGIPDLYRQESCNALGLRHTELNDDYLAIKTYFQRLRGTMNCSTLIDPLKAQASDDTLSQEN